MGVDDQHTQSAMLSVDLKKTVMIFINTITEFGLETKNHIYLS